MLRFLIKFLLLAIVLAVAAMLTAQWKLEKDLDEFARSIEPVAIFEYESAKVNLTGTVELNSISIFIESLAATIEIGELEFYAGDLYQLAFLQSNLKKRQLPENAHVIFRDVLMPFNRKMLNAVDRQAAPSSSDLLNAAYCGENQRIGVIELEAMGYDYFAFSGKEFFMLDKYSGSLVLNGQLDVEEMFQLEFQANIGGVMAWLESMEERQIGQYQKTTVKPDLSLFDIKLTDTGYNRKRAEYCALKQGVETAAFYDAHVAQVERMLSEVGVEFTEEGKQGYRQSIMPESKLHMFVQPKASFEFDGVNYYSYEEFMALSGLRVSVDGQPVNEIFASWPTGGFKQIALDHMKQQAAKNPTGPLYRQTVVSKSYQAKPATLASEFVEEKVRVQRDDGRMFLGSLAKADNKSIWLNIKTANGMVTMPIARSRVVKFEVYLVDN